MLVLKSLLLFLAAGLAEVGGGFDLLRALLCLCGVGIMMYWPRTAGS